jgi:isochorismate pyruvate lyase
VPDTLKLVSGLTEIRRRIDEIDREIVSLVARRNKLVHEVLEHKRGADIRVPEREEEVLANVRRLAAATGADMAVVERVYRAMIDAFVEYELREHPKAGEG